jgi:hypothetical protein
MSVESVLLAVTHELELLIITFTGLAAAAPTIRRKAINIKAIRLIEHPTI